MYHFIANLTLFTLAVIRWALILIFFLTIFGLILPYLTNVEAYPHLKPLITWEGQINHLITIYVPKVMGYNVSRWVTLILVLILIIMAKSIAERVKFASEKHRMLGDLRRIQLDNQTPERQEKIMMLRSKMEHAGFSAGKNREALLKDFAHIKKELEKIGRDLAFLSIDVVDSTGMKQGEEQATIELDFMEYHNFVEAKFKEHGLIKATWTPDGVMACFNTIEDAVQAAQDILNGLDYFNQHVKTLKRDFMIRCGVNGGHVYYDDAVPLEQFSDRVLDIAGHMQKHAPKNSILIAKQMIEPVKNRDNFIYTKRIVDGLEVCEWAGKKG